MMLRKLSVIAGLSLAFAGASVQAKGFESLLKGDYAFTGEAVCLVSRDGFDPNTLAPVGPPNPWPRIQSFSVHGVRTFNGDGTGHVVARVVTIAHPYTVPANPPNLSAPVFNRGSAGVVDIESPFTYAVSPDLKVEIETPLVTGNVLSGVRAGQTLEITQLPAFRGFVSQNLHSVTLVHDEAAVEIHSFSNGDVDSRICHRSRVLLERKAGK